MTIICGNKKESPSKRLFIICNEIYAHVKTNNPLVLTGYGCWLTEEHTIRVLARFSMRNPDLAFCHWNKDLTSVEALKYRKMPHVLECK